jgi:serine kinase of HPr protein (carbohydrate metabolism regulator)
MAAPLSETLHATTVAINGRALMLTGPSGSGKSDLALRLIDRGATLVSDDYTLVEKAGREVLASPPATIAGRMEVRGIGIVAMDHLSGVPVALMIGLIQAYDRMPEGPDMRMVAGIEIPSITLSALEASAPIKVEYALMAFGLNAD